MKAVYIEKHGGVEVLTAGELPDPSVGPNEVKVRVRACAINRVDVYARAGVRGTRLPASEKVANHDTANAAGTTDRACTTGSCRRQALALCRACGRSDRPIHGRLFAAQPVGVGRGFFLRPDRGGRIRAG